MCGLEIFTTVFWKLSKKRVEQIFCYFAITQQSELFQNSLRLRRLSLVVKITPDKCTIMWSSEKLTLPMEYVYDIRSSMQFVVSHENGWILVKSILNFPNPIKAFLLAKVKQRIIAYRDYRFRITSSSAT